MTMTDEKPVTTPLKGSSEQTLLRKSKTVETSVSVSPSSSSRSLEGTPTPSSPTQCHESTLQRRVNLMTLIVDMVPKPKQQQCSYPFRIHDQRHPHTHDNLNYLDNSDDESSFTMDASLQRMFSSTRKALSDEKQELEFEFAREYPPSACSVGVEEDDDQLSYEIRKLQNSEETFHSCIDHAVDKIAYRHSSTNDWAGNYFCGNKRNSSNEGSGKIRGHSQGGIGDFMERMLGLFCCDFSLCGYPSEKDMHHYHFGRRPSPSKK